MIEPLPEMKREVAHNAMSLMEKAHLNDFTALSVKVENEYPTFGTIEIGKSNSEKNVPEKDTQQFANNYTLLVKQELRIFHFPAGSQ